jgi:ATP/maltotriose-dependent transcriptional regulator MalT
LLRQFSEEKLTASGQLTAARDAHLLYFAGMMRNREADLTGRRLDVRRQESQPDVAQPAINPLTARELQVLQLIAQGQSNSEIAQELVIAVSTVKSHINKIFNKLNVSNRTQALVRAQALQLFS